MTQWHINITPAEALVLVVATILVVAVTVEAAKGTLDPPPLKWSAPRYGFEPEEDRDGEQEAQA